MLHRYGRLAARLLPSRSRSVPLAEADRPAERLEKDVRLLTEAILAERARGAAGHWSYDANRLLALREALSLARSLLGQDENRSGIRSR